MSLALRGDTRLRPEMIARIKAVAEKLGYAPDPMLAALASYRRGRRPRAKHETIAWVTNWPTRDGWRSRPMFGQFFEGAKRCATELGYQLEEFWLNGPGLNPRRASEILYARGVQDLILAPQPDGVSRLELEWARFRVVTIGPTLRQPELHMVSNSQYRTVVRMCEALARRGYQRIGYAIERHIDERMDGQWSAAFERFQRDLPAARKTERYEERQTQAGVRRWLKEEKPDVVFSCIETLAEWLKQRGVAGAGKVDFALIGVEHAELGCQGMREDAAAVGAAAVKRLAAMVHLGERGVPAVATRTLIDATWVEAGVAANGGA